jgi:p-hydroxybenzoate 3-monooxygenase
MRREGLVHHGIELRFGGRGHRIDFPALTGGRAITVYAQQEVVKDLIAARLAAGGRILFEADDVSVHDLQTDRPHVRFLHGGEPMELQCRLLAGCDGFHGVCREAIPAGVLSFYERVYPFAWFGVLAQAPPPSDELIYAAHERGFALYSMRSREISRLYLQVAPDEEAANWPDARIWRELRRRLGEEAGERLKEGAILEKGVTGMRSFIAEPMQYGRVYLAGDAAHIVPPTGAKGLNLAVADVRVLARAMAEYFKSGGEDLLRAYSATCLRACGAPSTSHGG